MIPKRNTALNVLTLRCVAEKAVIGAAKARPVRTPTGIASTIMGDAAAPNRAVTSTKTEDTSRTRKPIHAMLPSAMSLGRIGVANIAW